MPVKDRVYYNRNAERHGPYFLHHYASGGFNIWKTGWKNTHGLDVQSDEVIVRKYHEQIQIYGKPKESLLCMIAARAIPVCGYLSRDIGRQTLNLPKVDKNYGSVKCAKKAVNDYWLPKRTESGLFKPTKNEDRGINDFMHESPKSLSAYKYTARHLGGFRKAAEKWYRGLYREISIRRTHDNHVLTKKELTKTIIKRFNSGFCISPTYLRDSSDYEERELYRKVLDFAEKDLFGKKDAYIEMVHKLTGIPVHSIRMDDGANVHCGKLTESFTKFLFYWSSLLGLETWNIDNRQWTSSRRGDLALLREDKRYEADLRIGNKPIEVKTGIGRFSEDRREMIVEKYGKPGVWENNNQAVQKGTIIFHARPKLYAHFLPQLKEAGLTAVSYEDFQNHLINLIEKMKDKPMMYCDVRPITSLDYILKLHEETSLYPFLLVRTENNGRRQWGNHILTSLIERAQELRTAKFGGCINDAG